MRIEAALCSSVSIISPEGSNSMSRSPTVRELLRSRYPTGYVRDAIFGLAISLLITPACFGGGKESKFLTVRKEIPHGPKWTSVIEYSVVGDPAVDAMIRSVLKEDCYPGMMAVDDGRCSQTVTAEIVRSEFLILTIDNAEYETGSPHGSEDWETRTYMKAGDRWQPIARNGLLLDAAECQKRIASLVYGAIRPQLSSEQVKGSDTPADLLKMASQVPTEDGIRFAYQQYDFGGYVPPKPVVITYQDLGACFAPRTEASK